MASGKGLGGALVRAALAAAIVALVAGPAWAQEDLTLRGSVSGELARGRRATFHLAATHPGGWRSLQNLTVTLELAGAVLDEFTYEVDGIEVTTPEGGGAVLGTGNTVTSRFFRISALDVRVTTGGTDLDLSLTAGVLRSPPPGARFRFAAEDDEGDTASVSVRALVEEKDEISLLTVALAAGGALLAGGFLGARVGTRRRPQASVYASVQRRLEDQGSSPGRRPGR